MRYQAVVIGASAGGLEALRIVLSELPKTFPLPIIIVQHLSPQFESYLAEYLNSECNLFVKEIDEKEEILPGVIYIAPPNYHVLIEKDQTFSLSVEERVNFARPSIDVLFESAADIYKEQLIGIILTGANSDGSLGMKKIKERDGLTIVQDPSTAYSAIMPKATLLKGKVDYIFSLKKIRDFLIEICRDVER